MYGGVPALEGGERRVHLGFHGVEQVLVGSAVWTRIWRTIRVEKREMSANRLDIDAEDRGL